MATTINPNPGSQIFKVCLSRPNSSVSWGFRLQGGADFSTALSIQLVQPGSVAEQSGLQARDGILQINGAATETLDHETAKMEIIRAGNEIEFLVQRGAVTTWKPSVTSMSDLKPSELQAHTLPGNSAPVQKTSLTINQQQPVNHIGSSHNRSARPFGATQPQGRSTISPEAHVSIRDSFPDAAGRTTTRNQLQQEYLKECEGVVPKVDYDVQPSLRQQSYSPHQPTQPKPFSPTYQPTSPVYQPLSPGQQPMSPSQQPMSPSQQPMSPGRQPLSPGQQPMSPGSKVMHAQFNTPLGIYSNKNVGDTFQQQASVMKNDFGNMSLHDEHADKPIAVSHNNNNIMKSPTKLEPEKSAVQLALEQEEQPEIGLYKGGKVQSKSFKMLELELIEGERRMSATTTNGVAGVKSVQAPRAGAKMTGPRHKQPTSKCYVCGNFISGVFVRVKEHCLHSECLKCAQCGRNLKNIGYIWVQDSIYCVQHARELTRPPGGGYTAYVIDAPQDN
ncbi:PDZ and LIM domain protein 3-like isoform X1 [Watersipora subatra]|uniref:PDZ and LIM domain protein 3-like isoform X1 n=1 Tax=Watersipora subatra TaxID=2589382 RepID=UPI00355C34A9